MFGKEITEFYAVPLAEQGFVTFCPDAILFGERRVREHDEDELACGGQSRFLAEKILAFRYLLKGTTLTGAQVAEYIRCVDFLTGLPQTDQVVVMGHSMGGIYSFWLGAMDERVDATICLAGLLSYRLMADKGVSRYHGIYVVVPGLLSVCDTPDIVSLIPPRALYAVHAEDDFGFDMEGVHEIVTTASEVYAKCGAQGALVSKVVSGAHDDVLSEASLTAVFDWLKSRYCLP